MPSSRRLRAVALITALLVAPLSTACSGGGSDADPPRTTTTTAPATSTTAVAPDLGPQGEPYVDTLADALASGAAGGLPVDPEAAKCLAPRWVDVLGEDRLVEAGVTPQQLASGYGADTSAALGELIDDATATAMVDAFGACAVDVEQVFVDAITAGRDLPAAQEDCLKRAFPDGFVERALILGLSEGEAALGANIELNDTLTAAARECVS